MARKAPKMVGLTIDETSGVDHPAHLHEGWLVVKSVDTAEVDRIVESLASTAPEEESVDDETTTPADEPTVESLTEALAKAEATIADLQARLDALAPAPAPEAEPTGDDLLKAAPEAVVKMVEAARAEAAEAVAKAAAAEETLRKERETRADEEAVVKAAAAWPHLQIDPALMGPALRRLAGIDESLAKSVSDALTAANAQAESGAIFAEIGKSAAPTGGTAMERLEAMAKSAVAEGRFSTFEQAFADAVTTNPDLYTAHIEGK